MRIGVVSDTHGNLSNTQAAVRLLSSLDVEAVLHCGDIGTVEVIETIGTLDKPTHFVVGNTDYQPQVLAKAIEQCGMSYHDLFADLTLCGTRIALLHSHDQRQFAQVQSSGEYQLVCYGHTHVKKIAQVGDTVVLNPGALHRASVHSLAIVELPACEATIVDL